MQLDLEPFLPSDVPFLVDLLRAIRLEVGPDFMRAVFCPKYVRDPSPPFNPGYVWRRARPYARLLRESEQVLIPLYDYGHLVADATQDAARVKQVVRRFSRRSRGAQMVWLVLPSYRVTPNHGPEENLSNALEAIREAGASTRGAVIFVFTGDEKDFRPLGDVRWPE